MYKYSYKYKSNNWIESKWSSFFFLRAYTKLSAVEVFANKREHLLTIVADILS